MALSQALQRYSLFRQPDGSGRGLKLADQLVKRAPKKLRFPALRDSSK